MAPPLVASHASKWQSWRARVAPETSRGAPCSVRCRNSTCGVPACNSKTRAIRAEGRRTAPAAPTSRTALARIAASKTKRSVTCVPLVSFSSAGRPLNPSVRSRWSAAVRLVALVNWRPPHP
eukprot:7391630-Prymnesium_polylepis.3